MVAAAAAAAAAALQVMVDFALFDCSGALLMGR
jgi:hypothetical protein